MKYQHITGWLVAADQGGYSSLLYGVFRGFIYPFFTLFAVVSPLAEFPFLDWNASL